MLTSLRDFWSGRRREPASPEPLPPLSPEPLVDVVVVTRDRPELLKDVLAALARQTWVRHEVVVVDNSAAGSARAAAQQAGVQWVAAPGALGAARQAGVERAVGEIVAFTDDDCLPDPTWLQEIVRALLQQPDLWGVQGRTEAETGRVGSHIVRVARPDPLYQTCNMAYRRAALEAVGGFDPAFRGWFEDTALGARVLARGPIGFASAAPVVHRAMVRQPFDAEQWWVLLTDEHRLASTYPDFYRAHRGPGYLAVILGRWLIGSPLKTLLGELPRALEDPRGYAALARLLLRERRELIRTLLRSRSQREVSIGR